MTINVEPHPLFPEVYWVTVEDGHRKLGTKNLAEGHAVYGERLVRFEGVEYRLWDPFRSKLAAGILKGLNTVPIKPKQNVLYLGAASGTTASHVSDIIGEDGHIYCVEFASRSLRELVNSVAVYRYNMSPILADARMPETYSRMVPHVQSIYFDVAQPEQARVLADNADLFLSSGGWVLLAIKAQSIDVTKDPSVVFKNETVVLEGRGFRVQEIVGLEPFDKAHAMVVAQKI
ncbi:MAG: fibrillarin-like rRNA/tRNA 2'-O-methyltransferase [Candidatus Bathyarchaeia archaeon]